MNQRDYADFRAAFIQRTFEISDSKSREYAHDVDVLKNFKRTAEHLSTGNVAPETVATVFLQKHMDSITAIVGHIQQTGEVPDDLTEDLSGRFSDAINYLLLLLALIHERSAAEQLDHEQVISCVAEILGRECI